jgi:hypothetical protein
MKKRSKVENVELLLSHRPSHAVVGLQAAIKTEMGLEGIH